MSAVTDSGWLVAPFTTLNGGKITLLDIGSGHIVSVQTRLWMPCCIWHPDLSDTMLQTSFSSDFNTIINFTIVLPPLWFWWDKQSLLKAHQQGKGKSFSTNSSREKRPLWKLSLQTHWILGSFGLNRVSTSIFSVWGNASHPNLRRLQWHVYRAA